MPFQRDVANLLYFLPTALFLFVQVSEPAMEMLGSTELNDTIARIENHTNVSGLLVVNSSGQLVHSSLDDLQTTYYVQRCSGLVALARATIRDIDPTNDVQFLRVKSREYELLMATTKEYTLIVKQKTKASRIHGRLWENE